MGKGGEFATSPFLSFFAETPIYYLSLCDLRIQTKSATPPLPDSRNLITLPEMMLSERLNRRTIPWS